MGDKFDMSGDFQGAIINIKSTLTNVTQTVGKIAHADQSDKDELTRLITELGKLLEKTPQEQAADAEKVSGRLDTLVNEANKPKPDTEMMQITGESLKKAAANLVGVMPTVLVIATQIVDHVLKLVR